jgi:hypothetical protein
MLWIEVFGKITVTFSMLYRRLTSQSASEFIFSRSRARRLVVLHHNWGILAKTAAVGVGSALIHLTVLVCPPWFRILHEKLISALVAKTFPGFYWNLQFGTVFARIRHSVLSQATSILRWLFHLHLRFLSGRFPFLGTVSTNIVMSNDVGLHFYKLIKSKQRRGRNDDCDIRL